MRLVRAGTVAALAFLAAACDSTRPVEETAQASDCERCHGYPPAPPHPTISDCSMCHPTTVEADDVTLVPDGAHMNGVADATQTHDVPYPDHPADALAAIGSCAGCHGADYGGSGSADSCNDCHRDTVTPSPGFADWTTNCTFCHGTRTPSWPATPTPAQLALAAPPDSVEGGGEQTSANPDVGAHQAHLNPGTYSSGFACTTCHAVPTAALALSHFSARTADATVAFDALATQGAASATYTGGACAVYCHGSGTSWPAGSVAANPTPAWTSTGLACDACHASRPATPAGAPAAASHFSNQHRYLGSGTTSGPEVPCAYCHFGYVQDTSVDLDLHVDGARTVVFESRGGPVVTLTNPGWGSCTATCHDSGANGNRNAPAF